MLSVRNTYLFRALAKVYNLLSKTAQKLTGEERMLHIKRQSGAVALAFRLTLVSLARRCAAGLYGLVLIRH